jgi:hypothetical protein
MPCGAIPFAAPRLASSTEQEGRTPDLQPGSHLPRASSLAGSIFQIQEFETHYWQTPSSRPTPYQAIGFTPPMTAIERFSCQCVGLLLQVLIDPNGNAENNHEKPGQKSDDEHYPSHHQRKREQINQYIQQPVSQGGTQ